MARIRHLLLCVAAGPALAVAGPPAIALAHTTGHRAAGGCHGPVFSGVKLRDVASHLYLAQSTTSDQAVLYGNTKQSWDGYRDTHGYLVIYRCGTDDVLTDVLAAHCKKNFMACAEVEPFTDSTTQRWTRKVFDHGSAWTIQSLAAGGLNKVINDPHGSTASGTVAVMSKYTVKTSEQFSWHS